MQLQPRFYDKDELERRSGKTTRSLKLVCKLLAEGNTRVYCKLKKIRDFDYTSKMLLDIILEGDYQRDGRSLVVERISTRDLRVVTSLGFVDFFSLGSTTEEEYMRGRDRNAQIVSLIDY